MKKMTLVSLLVGLLISLMVGGTAVAQSAPPEPPMPPIPIDPPIWNVEGLKIEYQRVDVTIEDQVATTHIDQLFVNENDWMLEGTYLFPLPEGAAVSQLTMWVDGQPIEAKILEQAEARQIYDEIVRQLRDPALLEYVGTQAIQANVFPIPPRDERRIEIEYSQILPADNGLIHYVFPQSTNLYTNTALDSQSIRVDVTSNEEIHTIYSPSHRVAVNRDGRYHAIVGYEDENVIADTDFELYYSVSPEDIGLNLLSYKESGQDGFFLLMVSPSVETDQVIAKDVIVVVDTSGSMEGQKMAQAQDAALYIADHLNPSDRFNIIAFSTGTRSYEPQLVSADSPGNYEQFINGLEAIGGTNISQSLLEAANQADGDRPTTIIFITDGLATEGITDTPLLLDTVEQALPDNVRIFTFGVGDDVDPILLDSLAQNHRGTSTYVRQGQSIDEAVSSFYAKVSAPVLTDIDLDFGDIIVEQMYPSELPDLFAGTQLVIAGRYRNGGATPITLSGTVNGEPQEFVYEDNLFRSNGGDEFIPRLWATRAIGHLLTQIRLHGETEELVQSVVNLSIRYGIITPYTSYLIEEDDIFSQSGRTGIMEDEIMVEGEVMDAPAEMVEEAAASADMAAAEAPMALPTAPMMSDGDVANGGATAVNEVVKLVGSKTFVLRDGVWMDTTYDSDVMTPQTVGFASDTYFDLLTAVPDLGQYLALGSQVLVVYDDQVYQIVEGASDGDVTLPTVTDDADAVSTSEPNETDATDEPNEFLPEPTQIASEDLDRQPPEESASSGICTAAIAMPLLLGLVGGWGALNGRRRKK